MTPPVGIGPDAGEKLAVTINGEAAEVEAGSTLLDWLASRELDPRTVAIEHNGSIVPRGRFAETPIVSGDRLEVVRFVQGG